MIFYLGHKVDVVDTQVRKLRNKQKSWEYGYNEQIDTVIISKDGTLGDVYNMCGLNVGLPEVPVPANILNNGKTSTNQKFYREELPLGLNSSNWQQPKFEQYVDEQFKRRLNGIWIYIKGKPIYIPGTYYFGLQWIREELKYPKFRVIQNELMIFWEACKADERCYGMQYVKNRRFGATLLGIFEFLESGTITSNKILGMISKKGKDAKKIFTRLVRAFKRLPPFFMPETDGNTTPKTELIFAKPSRKKTKGETMAAEESLETEISWHNTEANAMDGEKIFRSLLDESGKYPKDVPFDEYWYVVKTSHRLGRIIAGKSFVISTVNDLNKGGREFKSIWDQSNVEKRNENGQTKSGLYRVFIPAKYGLEGFYDEYGFSIVETPTKNILTDAGDYIGPTGTVKLGAWDYLQAELESLKDEPNKYNEHLRQFPNTDRDAFRAAADDCAFNVLNLIEQLDHNLNELEENSDFSNKDLERGNFIWKDGVQDTEVIWKPDHVKGRFWIAKDCHPKVENRNQKIKKIIHGVEAWAPVNDDIGCFGVDPFNRSTTVDGRGSKGSIHLYTNMNAWHFPNNVFILEYIDRPPTVEMFYEDVIMAMVYYSIPMLPEFSSDKFSQFILDRGYRHFVKNNPHVQWKDLSTEEQKYGGVNAQNQKFRERQYQTINTYIEQYVGVAKDRDNRALGQMGFMPFSRTLNQWKEFDPNAARTKFDGYISSSLALIGTQNRFSLNVSPPPKPIRIPYKKYNNEGLISTPA